MAASFMGCGTGTVGRLEQPDGSYHTTEWFMILFFPLIPLKSYRVISESKTLRGVPLVYASQQTTMRVEQRRMDWPHVWRVYRGLCIFAAVIAGLFVWGHYASTSPAQ
jgi:hypothetical protein